MTDTIDDVAAEDSSQQEAPALDELGVAEQLVSQARKKGIEPVGPNGLLSQSVVQRAARRTGRGAAGPAGGSTRLGLRRPGHLCSHRLGDGDLPVAGLRGRPVDHWRRALWAGHRGLSVRAPSVRIMRKVRGRQRRIA
jgi:hypothetical protein